MTTRLNPYEASAETMQAVVALENHIQNAGLEPGLLDLIKTRASQINGCGFCINMHTQEARQRGESEQRLHLLNAWRESALYSAREKAALAWTEALTLINENHVTDRVYNEASQHFSEQELVTLTVAVGMINTWNRIAISFRIQAS